MKTISAVLAASSAIWWIRWTVIAQLSNINHPFTEDAQMRVVLSIAALSSSMLWARWEWSRKP